MNSWVLLGAMVLFVVLSFLFPFGSVHMWVSVVLSGVFWLSHMIKRMEELKKK